MKKILHLGVGNFFRAHQAWYTQEVSDDWRYIGVSLRRAEMRDDLRSQDWHYTLAISRAGKTDYLDIGVIDDILVAPENPSAVVSAISNPDVHIISLTVTEKGYSLNGAGALDLTDTGIAADLSGTPPVTTIGFLAAGLHARAGHGAPVTILSCDNLPENGMKLEAAVRRFAQEANLDISAYLDEFVSFPSSMVDRIVPATDAELVRKVSATPLPAKAPVATENYTEWVIEDRFAGPRPAWEKAGAVLTNAVSPFEIRKLRMLNGAHSALAYAGVLAGYEFVHEAIADADLRALAVGVMQEAGAILPPEISATTADYTSALLERFANPKLDHKLRQIAMDGSLKMPIRILSTITDRKEIGLDSPHCTAALEAYSEFIAAETAAGRRLDDPNSNGLADHVASGKDVRDFLGGVS